MVATRRILHSSLMATTLALSGCSGAAPVLPITTTPVVVETASQTPAANPASDEFTTLLGQVALRGMPWVNAPLQIVDAMTGKPAGTPGSALRVEGDLKTDAQGHFSVRVAGLGEGKVARVIATLASGTLSALVSHEGVMAGAYSVQAATFSLKVNEISLCLDQLASGVLKMAGGLKPSVAAALIRNMLKDLSAMAPKLETAFAQDDMLAITLSLTVNPLTGLATDGANVMNVLLEAGLGDAVDAAIKNATSSVAQLAGDRLNVVNADALENVTLIGSTLTLTVVNGVFKVTDPKTGESFTIDLPALTPVVPPAASSGGGGNDNPPSVSFNPKATFDTQGSTIRLKVTQLGGESDIASLVVRVPVLPALGAEQINDLTGAPPTERISSPGGHIQVGAISMAMTVESDDSQLDFTGMPGAPFGQALNYDMGKEASGRIVVTTPSNGSATLGNVRVFTSSNAAWWSATNVYVAAKYMDAPAFNNATSLKMAQDHATSLDFNLKGNVTFPQASGLVIDVCLTPRHGSASARTVRATYDASVIQ